MHRLIVLTFLFFILIFSGCEKPANHSVLKVGISPWPGYEPLALASEKGFYQGDTHIRVIHFSTPSESFRALRDGLIDVAAFTADEVFHYTEVKSVPKIFMVLDVSNGADAIVAKKSIKNLEQLKEKTLAVQGTTLGHYILNRSLDFTNNIKLSDIKIDTIPINNQVEAFKEGRIDAAITYEPAKSLLLSQGAHILFDSSQIPNEVFDVLVTNDKTIRTRSDDLKVLMDGWFRTLDYINKNYTVAMKELANIEGTSIKNFTHSFTKIKIPNKEENINMLKNNGSLIKSMERLSNLMFEKGNLKKNIDVKTFIDNRILDLQEK